jgi:D-sedoheptulose 7-phosphate isomerase
VSYSQNHLDEAIQITSAINAEIIEEMVKLLKIVKEDKGRVFFLGVGGSAANAGHAVNDFRKLAGIESYAPTDNVAELTARTNDEGWQTVFSAWLKVSKINEKDC